MENETTKKAVTGDLTITLKSDLCAGSGYAYAGIIDQDVCYDAFGIPYIPAKRIKGLLREASELIGVSEEERKQLFGESGMKDVQGIYLENAYIKGYDALVNELSAFQKSVAVDKQAIEHPFHTQNILEQFTTVKAQTKIGKDGTADDTSLRFTRTVNHYTPWTEGNKAKELEFVSRITYYNENLNELLEKVAKALRNIGLNRNRGLGSVSCTYQVVSEDNQGTSQMGQIEGEIQDDAKEYILEYTIENTAPLMLSGGNDSISEKYISGQSVLGYFAGAYIKKGCDSDSQEFRDLFLKNQIIFSNLYPVCKNTTCYPAPAYINKYKKTGELLNVSHWTQEIENKSKEGNQPKKLRGKFLGTDTAGSMYVHEVESEIVFHHSKSATKSIDVHRGNQKQGQLYSQEVISVGQQFRGQIQGSGKVLKDIKEILENASLRFGKSKSAQYGSCRLVNGRVTEVKEAETIQCNKGDKIMVVLRSDAIFMDESCGYTVRQDKVREEIKSTLHILEDENSESVYSEIEVKELTGYYTKWNLKRQAIPVVEAGSAFEFIVGEDGQQIVTKAAIGERIGEGYGQLEILKSSAIQICDEKEESDEKPVETECIPQSDPVTFALSGVKELRLKEMYLNILKAEIKEQLCAKALDEYKAKAKESGWNSAALGRVILMLTESREESKGDADATYQAFKTRIDTIKNLNTQERAEKLIDEYICSIKEADLKQAQLKYEDHIDKKMRDWYQTLAGEEAYKKMLIDCWMDYMLLVLTGIKYGLK